MPVATEQDGESFFIKCSMLKHALLPGRRAKTSIVWNFRSVVHLVCHIQHMVKKKKKRSTVGSQVLIWGHWLFGDISTQSVVYIGLWLTARCLSCKRCRDGEYVCNVSIISPDSSFSRGSLTYVLSSYVGSDGVAEPAGWFFSWKRRSGLQMCPGRQELSKRFDIDVGRTSAAIAAAAIVDPGASGEDSIASVKKTPIKSLLMPEIRTNTSVVWNFSVDPWYIWHAPCNVWKVCWAGQGLALALPCCSNTCRPRILQTGPGPKFNGAVGNLKLGKHFWIFLLFHMNFCPMKVMYWAISFQRIGLEPVVV